MATPHIASPPDQQLTGLRASREHTRDTIGSMIDYLISGIVVVFIGFALALSESQFYHWFIIPTMVGGTFVGADVVRWWRGALDPFDPQALIAIVVFYGFSVAPLLHAGWQFYTFPFAGDPRPWLGLAILLNTVGYLFYKVAQLWAFRHTTPITTTWQMVPGRLFPILSVATVVAVSANLYFYLVVIAPLRSVSPEAAARGYGWLLMLGDPLIALYLTGFISLTALPQRNRNWLIVALILLIGSVAQFFWVGLRGSRSATVVGVFWAAGLIHYYWRRFSPMHLLLGIVVLLTFLYLYGFYKSGGMRAINAMETGVKLEELERSTGRTLYALMLGDLSRAEVQARIAEEVATGLNRYQLRYGRTYLEGLSKLIPYSIWDYVLGDLSFKDDWGKSKAFAELNYGKGHPDAAIRRPSCVYGLTGEAMLNFGFLGVPTAWLLFGLFVGWLRRKMATMTPTDTRWTMLLFLSYLAMMITVGDLDNIVFTFFKVGVVIFLCIFMWSQIVNREHH